MTLNRNLKRAILARHAEVLSWLSRLPRVYETPAQIFVHAGVDEQAGELWRAATPDYVLTEKYPATVGPFLKTVVAGHVRTCSLHEDGVARRLPRRSSHCFIDGSVETTGRLNILRYDHATGVYGGLSAN